MEVAGQLKISALLKRCEALDFSLVNKAIAAITDTETIATTSPDYSQTSSKRDRGGNGITNRTLRLTNAKYRTHIRGFSQPPDNRRLLTKVPAKLLKFCSTYFAVPKTETTSRAIFNGKRLSTYWPTPAPVNICDTATLIRKILETAERCKKLWITVGDFRHWFHQIPVNLELARHFGIALSPAETFLWRTLPMGWSHIPHIAQAIAWGVLCARQDNQKPFLMKNSLEVNSYPRLFRPPQVDGSPCTTTILC